MTTGDEGRTAYQILAEIIYAEHPDHKVSLNNGAQLAIESIRNAITADLSNEDVESILAILAAIAADLSNEDVESILAIIAAIAADLLTTPVNSISEKVNLIFDIHSLAAGAVIGEIDLGDVSAAKDMATLIKEAREQTEGHTGGTWDDQTGQYL